MTNTPHPPEGTLENKLEYLYVRRAIIDELIRSLERYDETCQGRVSRKTTAMRGTLGSWCRSLAS